MINVGIYTWDEAKNEIKINNNIIVKPTKIEGKIISYIFSHKGRVVSIEELIGFVWGTFRTIGAHAALKTRITVLRKKIGKEFLTTINGVGYILEDNLKVQPKDTIDKEIELPSKELIEKVVGYDDVKEINFDSIGYNMVNITYGNNFICKINIYELLDKCKEFLFKHYRSIEIIENTDRIQIKLPLAKFDSGLEESLKHDILPFNKRFKVITDACQWILLNILHK